MGVDKGLIDYHGVAQRVYLYRLLEKLCDRVFLSIREDQREGIESGMNVIVDRDRENGPFNGLLSAHERHPEAAWLVLACDLPLMDLPSLKLLIDSRATTGKATAFATRESGLPEPLCAIWEPDAFEEAKKWLASGSSTCPRKFLLGSDIRVIHPKNEKVLLNANSKGEYEEVVKELASS